MQPLSHHGGRTGPVNGWSLEGPAQDSTVPMGKGGRYSRPLSHCPVSSGGDANIGDPEMTPLGEHTVPAGPSSPSPTVALPHLTMFPCCAKVSTACSSSVTVVGSSLRNQLARMRMVASSTVAATSGDRSSWPRRRERQKEWVRKGHPAAAWNLGPYTGGKCALGFGGTGKEAGALLKNTVTPCPSPWRAVTRSAQSPWASLIRGVVGDGSEKRAQKGWVMNDR